MNPISAVWNVLHDGGVDKIRGTVPGEVTLTVGILYLREMFTSDGESISVRLQGCRSLGMEVWRSDGETSFTDDHREIESLELEILNTESVDSPVDVVTTHGMLKLDFDRIALSLDSGEEISFDDLCDARTRYWKRWEEGAKNGRRSQSGK